MKVYFAADHAGFDLKRVLLARLAAQGHEAEDMGPYALDPEDDYPDYILPLARRVATEPGSRGIVIGGSGQGEAMAANRIPGARAAVFYGGATDVLLATRADNDANILSVGARFVSEKEAKEAAKIFLETPFSNASRHARRIASF